MIFISRSPNGGGYFYAYFAFIRLNRHNLTLFSCRIGRFQREAKREFRTYYRQRRSLPKSKGLAQNRGEIPETVRQKSCLANR